MKFSNGYWINREGVQVHGAVDLRAFEIRNGVPTAFISPIQVTSRGQTLNSPLLTVEFDAPAPDIIGVRAYHFKGSPCEEPAFILNTRPLRFEITENDAGITLRSGKISVVLHRRPFAMRFYYEDTLLTQSDTKQLAYIETPNGSYMRERLDISIGELFYGLGERFTPFVKNGQSVDIWNEDGGTASELTYKNIPFCLSSRGYGVFVPDPGPVSFEIASEAVSKNQFSVPGQELRYHIIGGGSPRKALSNYTAFTGKVKTPPAWSFGLWLSTSFTTDYNERTVTGFIQGMIDRDIPLSVFHFDCFWMKEYEWCNFTWDAAMFSDVKEMLARVKAKTDPPLRVCVWINPYIGQKSPLFDEAMGNGYLLKKTDGGVWQWDMWQPGMGIVDFTNPDAVKWYQDKLTTLLDMGVDCFKTDFGERIPTDVIYHNGADPEKMHNYYTLLYNRAVYELLAAKRGAGGAVLFARSATAGGQRYPVHWGGDSFATYASMAESLRGGLSLACCGFAFWSHDIGGFESTATPDLYKRWLAFGLFSTHSRLHGSDSYRAPWLFDEEASDVLRFFTKTKQSLMPYIYAQSVASCDEGVPVMRPMALMYPDDPICGWLDRQYMLGENLMVAPVFHSDGHCEYYLPEGVFTNLFTGAAKRGGRYYTDNCDYFQMPVYVMENTLLPRAGNEVHVYEPRVGVPAKAVIYYEDGESVVSITGLRDEQGMYELAFEWNGGGIADYRVIIHNAAGKVSGVTAPDSGEKILFEEIGVDFSFTVPAGILRVNIE
ncbi:MAG: alpha-xylosidase [Clostridiales bacterium]|jgi:alpha-D-xyloside xylohydrolase|nr:alpha-xylosidase [Clostridiales bacterium]